MRTFFRDKFSDPAAITDLMVFGGRELSRLHGNRGVTKYKDKAYEGLYTFGKSLERLRCLQGPAGPGPTYDWSKIGRIGSPRDRGQVG